MAPLIHCMAALPCIALPVIWCGALKSGSKLKSGLFLSLLRLVLSHFGVFDKNSS